MESQEPSSSNSQHTETNKKENFAAGKGPEASQQPVMQLLLVVVTKQIKSMLLQATFQEISGLNVTFPQCLTLKLCSVTPVAATARRETQALCQLAVLLHNSLSKSAI